MTLICTFLQSASPPDLLREWPTLLPRSGIGYHAAMTAPLFSRRPGRHERHLMRRHDNPLFPADRRLVTEADVMAARRLDQRETEAFMERFRDLVQRAIDLEPHVQSDVLLRLKEDFDKAYEECASLGGDQSRIKEAIETLVEKIMNAIRKGAEGDPVAMRKLDEEEEARRLHYRLLEHPLIADLLHPETVIDENELLPALLSADDDEFQAALELFTPKQLAVLVSGCRSLIDRLPPEAPRLARTRERLQEMETLAASRADTDSVN